MFPLLVLATVASVPVDPSIPPAEEIDAPARRLAVAPANASELVVIDLETGEPVSTLSLTAPATYASALTEDGRYLLAAHDDGVSVIDGGAWSESHGDHAHHYAATPRLVGYIEGGHPSHLISHDGTSALWFDALGEAAVIDEASFDDQELTPTGSIGSAGPHHGFAIPAGDGQFLVSALAGPDDEGLPDTITVTDGDGTVTDTFECVDTHGEASFGRGLYGAACADGILVLTDADGTWTGELVAYPDTDDVDPYGMGAARAWAIASGSETAYGVGTFGTTHLFVLDPTSNELITYDLGAQIATFGVQPLGSSDDVLVLTIDGAVHLVDPHDGTVRTSLDVVEPFEEGADFEGSYYQLVVGGESAFVSNPADHTVVEVTLGDTLTMGDTIELGVEPAFVEVFNG